jgi:hypothetical protein
MTMALPPVSGPPTPGPASGATPVRRADPAPDRPFAVPAPAQQQPAEVPPAVQVDVAAAAARYEELERMGRRLHFGIHPATGAIVVEVRDLANRLVRTIPPHEALAVVSGEAMP